jgi:uncharacterized protein with ATP-grasp and redox domains
MEANMRHECHSCHIKTIEKLIMKFKPDAETEEKLRASIHKLLTDNSELGNPELATQIHRIAKKYLDNTNLYAEEKLQANEALLNSYSDWESLVNESDNPFFTAVKLAVIGNIIDYGAHSVSTNIRQQIDSFLDKELTINMTEKLRCEIEKAERILYLGDNCGEIVFDKLLIQTINHPNITFAVRGKPVINDATLEDVHQVGIDKLCKVISNGTDAPSTLLELSSSEFVKEYQNADLIISKGQGNFEGLMDKNHENTFFMLIAKCEPIANLLNVNENDMVVTKLSSSLTL